MFHHFSATLIKQNTLAWRGWQALLYFLHWTGVFGIGFWAFLVLLLVEYQIDVFW
jgi:hypothetical protein